MENAADKDHLRDLGISHIVNAAFVTVENKHLRDFDYCNVEIRDHEGEDISQHFRTTIDYIKSARKLNAKILLHCIAGVSRSPSLVIAYLIKQHRMPLDAAFKFVKIKTHNSYIIQLV